MSGTLAAETQPRLRTSIMRQVFTFLVVALTPSVRGSSPTVAYSGALPPTSLENACMITDLPTIATPCTWHRPSAVGSTTDCATADLLRQVYKADVTRADVELVVVSHDNDLAWTEPFSSIRTVYQHGKLAPGARDDEHVVRLRNVGREQHGILTHIVRRWDSLSERTAFMQGGAPSCGCVVREGVGIGGHLLANVSAADYLSHPLTHATSKDAALFMPLTARIDANLSAVSLRSGFAPPPADPLEAVATGPYANLGTTPRPVAQTPPLAPAPSTSGGIALDRWLPWERIDIGHGLPADRLSFRDFFERIIGYAPPPVLLYAQGAQFAASRQVRPPPPRTTPRPRLPAFSR